jgi:hypothetical protein
MQVSRLILIAFLVTSSRAFVNVRFAPPSASSCRQERPPIESSNDAAWRTTDISLCASSLEVNISNEDDVFDDETGNQSPLLADDETSSISPATEDLPIEMLEFPRHSLPGVNDVLVVTEALIQNLHQDSKRVDPTTTQRSMSPMVNSHDSIFANTYVDMGYVDTVGFDYDYTLVHYTEELLVLLYSMALNRLVNDRCYPPEMLKSGLVYDNFFSIRGLAVDKETGWICHLSYTHKVAVAWEGREKVKTKQIFEEYRGKRGLNPRERRARLKPLNDLFSMAECCLIADTIQFFKDNEIDFCPSNVVTDILGAIRDTHISGDFHRIVANNPEKYFDVTPHLKDVLENLKDSGKRLIFARYENKKSEKKEFDLRCCFRNGLGSSISHFFLFFPKKNPQ